ncbi:MFS general substrate transporter [Penicillium malachiteum]|uniref:MFS general substrate transporter n=1 Tax=Penicillium malachiteum TaxID=1324776 RepID=A0AAD6HBG5_9EURO|nr:MFS general substrate transporter [Penicillium malachiteum]
MKVTPTKETYRALLISVLWRAMTPHMDKHYILSQQRTPMIHSSALTGPSVYITIFSEEFEISSADASGLISYANLAFSFGSLILVPMYLKIGGRPVTLLSMITFLVGLIGASQCTSYSGLMVARVFQGLGSGVCESLPVYMPMPRINRTTVCRRHACWWVFMAPLLLIMAFLFVEEPTYHRETQSTPPLSSTDSLDIGDKDVKLDSPQQSFHASASATLMRKIYLSTLKPWSAVDHDAEFMMTMLRSFTYFLVPAFFWVIASYDLYIGLGALAFNYTFPIKIVESPYNWSETNPGLIAIASFVGYLLALPFTSSSDRLAAHRTKRNNGIREAEMRLPVLFQ